MNKQTYFRWMIIEIALAALMVLCCIFDITTGNIVLSIWCGIAAICDIWAAYCNWKAYKRLKDKEKCK